MKTFVVIVGACLLTLAAVGCGAPTRAETEQQGVDISILKQEGAKLQRAVVRQEEINARLDAIGVRSEP